jgi:hypothetical protein
MGRAYIPETQNAASIANLLQPSFQFVVDTTPVRFDAAKYHLPNGAIDFVTAISDLKEEEAFKRRLSGELILMTSDPDSDLESATDYGNHPLHEQCYFYHDSVPFAKNLAIISTYVWQHLPIVEGVRAAATGEREVQPYLLYCFAMIALDRCLHSPLPHHGETRGCPLDYCEVVGDIDRFLIHGRGFCADCKRLLQERQRDGGIMPEHLRAIQWLLLRATGAPKQYDVFISHAWEDKKAIAEPLYNELSARGIRVWFDEATLQPGDSLTDKINDGLSNSRFGIVILSKMFFNKNWPQRELRTMFALEDKDQLIIPILHGIGIDDVRHYFPLLADRLAGRSSEGIPALADQLERVIAM